MKISVNTSYQNQWENPNSENQIDFDHISTPSTSYGFIYCYDMDVPESAPNDYFDHNSSSTFDNPVGFYDLFSTLADRVDYVENGDAKKTTIIAALRRSKKYRAFFFAGFAHGGRINPPGIDAPEEGKSWSYMSLPSDPDWQVPPEHADNSYWQTYMNKELYSFEIWDELKDANNMCTMFFDACYVYGMHDGIDNTIIKPEITEPELMPRTSQMNGNFGMEIIDLFNSSNNQMQERGVAFENGIKLQIITATSSYDKQAWYYKRQYTTFSRACAYNIIPNMQERDNYIYDPDGGNTKYTQPIRNRKKFDRRQIDYIQYIRCSMWNALYNTVGADNIEGSIASYGYVGDDLSKKMIWC